MDNTLLARLQMCTDSCSRFPAGQEYRVRCRWVRNQVKADARRRDSGQSLFIRFFRLRVSARLEFLLVQCYDRSTGVTTAVVRTELICVPQLLQFFGYTARYHKLAVEISCFQFGQAASRRRPAA